MNTQFNSNVIWLQLKYKISTLDVIQLHNWETTKTLCVPIILAGFSTRAQEDWRRGVYQPLEFCSEFCCYSQSVSRKKSWTTVVILLKISCENAAAAAALESLSLLYYTVEYYLDILSVCFWPLSAIIWCTKSDI